MNIYQSLVRPILFNLLKADPEQLHSSTLSSLSWLERNLHTVGVSSISRSLEKNLCVSDRKLEQNLFGLHFPNPMGLAAGFDKDGVAATIWSHFGFGFAELGTVTYLAQPGNPKPRLFRLPSDYAALNRMGFNNRGAEAMATRLKSIGINSSSIPIGINLGKSKVTPLADAADDYLNSFRLLKDYGKYFVVNVSSPNTPGLRKLQDASFLASILTALQKENSLRKPIFVKIAPDLEWEAIADIISLAQQSGLAGIIATNTTISREGLKTQAIERTGNSPQQEAGGISGAPVRDRSTEVIRYIYQQTGGEMPIIGVGGVFNAEDAWEKITAGATLVQVYTGWIYQGPTMIRQILEGLLVKLEQNKLNSISEAVGLQVKQQKSI